MYEEEEENNDCPVCGKEDSNGVPCSKDCLKADLM